MSIFLLQVDPTSCILIVGFKDGIMRTLLLHPEHLITQKTMLDVRVHSNLTIHSEDSLHPDTIDLISVTYQFRFINFVN